MMYSIHSGNYREEKKDLRVYASTYSRIYLYMYISQYLRLYGFSLRGRKQYRVREKEKESNQSEDLKEETMLRINEKHIRANVYTGNIWCLMLRFEENVKQ